MENHGHLPVTFESNCCSIESDVEGAPWLLMARPMASTVFPTAMAHGSSFSMTTYKGALTEGLGEGGVKAPARIRAVVGDSIGRQFRSEWVDLKD